MGVMAWGMWRARYWAVLGFQLILVFLIFSAVLGLAVQAATFGRIVATLGLLTVSAGFFYFMVKAMARIQMPTAPPLGDPSERSDRRSEFDGMRHLDVIVIGGWPRRLRRRDPRRPAGQKDGRRRARQGRRPLPQLRLHPGKDDPAHRGALRPGPQQRRARDQRQGSLARLGRPRTPPAAVSESLSSGVKMLWEKNKITVIEGDGSLTADGNVVVGGETYEAAAVVLATGSVALPIPGRRVRRAAFVDTWGAWSLPEQPKKIAVVGAGASGCEIASAYGRFGTEVLLIEMLDQILPAEDRDIAASSSASSRNKASDLDRRAGARTSRSGGDSVKFTYGDKSRRGRLPLHRRRPRSRHRGPGPCRGGVELAKTARSKSTPTSAPPTPRSSRSATWSTPRRSPTRPPRRASSPSNTPPASRPAGQPGSDRRRHLQPPAGGKRRAHRGGSEEAGHEVKVGKLKISGGVGAATVYDDKDGLVKLVVDAKYGEILGAHIVGNRACDMIAELVATMALEGGLPGAGSGSSTPPDGLRGGPRRGPSRRRLGDPRLAVPREPPSITTSGRPTPTWRRSGSAGSSPRPGSSSRSGSRSCSADCLRRFDRDSWANGRGRAEGMAEVERRSAAYGLPPISWPDPWPDQHPARDAGWRPSPSRPAAPSPSPSPPSARRSPPANDLSVPDNVLIAGGGLRAAPNARY